MLRRLPQFETPGVAVLLLALTVAGCSGGAGDAPVRKQVTLSPSLQKTYDTTCKTCHEDAASGAPRTGDTGAWAKPLTQPRGVLVDHVMNGYNKMPPMGMCMHCTEADVATLTEYMAGAELK